MTYSVLMEVASQRDEQIAARSRLPRLDSTASGKKARRTGKRGPNGRRAGLLTRMGRT